MSNGTLIVYFSGFEEDEKAANARRAQERLEEDGVRSRLVMAKNEYGETVPALAIERGTVRVGSSEELYVRAVGLVPGSSVPRREPLEDVLYVAYVTR